MVLHLVELVRARNFRGRGARQVLGPRQPALQPLGAVREAAPDGPRARGQAPLVERHQEADGAGAPVVAGRGGAGALALHELRHLAVQRELRPVDGEVHRAGNALREDLPRRPPPVGVPLREVDHRLLRAPQVERGAAGVHRPPDGAHVGVGVAVEKLEEEREVVRVALVRRGGQQQQVVRRVAQQLAQLVPLALVRFVARRHPVRLVHDHQVPVRLAQARQDVAALREVERGHRPRLPHPLVHAELRAQVAAAQHDERLVELLPQLALPLEREVRGGDDQDALGEAPQPQLADQQPGHDRLARAGVVGEQEPHPRRLQQVVVDRLQLVRQRVDARDRQREVRVELPGDAEDVGLQPQPQQRAVPVVPEAAVAHGQPGQVGRAEHDLAEALGPRADQTERPAGGTRRGDGLHPHRLVEERPGENLACAGSGWRPGHRQGSVVVPLSCMSRPRTTRSFVPEIGSPPDVDAGVYYYTRHRRHGEWT